jgi:uncharacterized protein YuzE
VNAAYIYLVEEIGWGEVEETCVSSVYLDGVSIQFDFDRDRFLLGIEVLGASRVLAQLASHVSPSSMDCESTEGPPDCQVPPSITYDADGDTARIHLGKEVDWSKVAATICPSGVDLDRSSIRLDFDENNFLLRIEIIGVSRVLRCRSLPEGC